MENVNNYVSSKHNLKKLDLNSINLRYGRNHEKDSHSLNNEFKLSGKNVTRGAITEQKMKTEELKENFLDDILTKDYENFIEFLSSEEFFYDKLVNLRIPFFFLNNHKKSLSYTETNNLKVDKIKSETEEFSCKYIHKFSETTRATQKIIPTSKTRK